MGNHSLSAWIGIGDSCYCPQGWCLTLFGNGSMLPGHMSVHDGNDELAPSNGVTRWQLEMLVVDDGAAGTTSPRQKGLRLHGLFPAARGPRDRIRHGATWCCASWRSLCRVGTEDAAVIPWRSDLVGATEFVTVCSYSLPNNIRSNHVNVVIVDLQLMQ